VVRQGRVGSAAEALEQATHRTQAQGDSSSAQQMCRHASSSPGPAPTEVH